jgi:glycine betaine/proline transport system ATP-binding protein
MKKTEIAYLSAGPHQALRQMKKLSVSSLFVLDKDRKFKGVVKLEEVAERAKKVPEEDDEAETIADLVHDDYFSTGPETPVSDLLEQSARNVVPIAVVDEEGTFLGIVSRPAILFGIAG